jgi:hypothetical protein
MSIGIVFKPVIPKTFSKQVKVQVKVKRPAPKPWTNVDLMRLINLRAMGVSYKDCGPLLSRSMGACVAIIESNNLYGTISTRHHVLIKDILR